MSYEKTNHTSTRPRKESKLRRIPIRPTSAIILPYIRENFDPTRLVINCPRHPPERIYDQSHKNPPRHEIHQNCRGTNPSCPSSFIVIVIQRVYAQYDCGYQRDDRCEYRDSDTTCSPKDTKLGGMRRWEEVVVGEKVEYVEGECAQRFDEAGESCRVGLVVACI